MPNQSFADKLSQLGLNTEDNSPKLFSKQVDFSSPESQVDAEYVQRRSSDLAAQKAAEMRSINRENAARQQAGLPAIQVDQGQKPASSGAALGGVSAGLSSLNQATGGQSEGLGIASAAASGALTGSMIAPGVGTVVGAAVGTLGAVLSSKSKKKAARAAAAAREEELRKQRKAQAFSNISSIKQEEGRSKSNALQNISQSLQNAFIRR